jgi:glutamate racemase
MNVDVAAGPAPSVTAPIGVVDSGVGGLTVVRAVLDQLPHESVVYIGDTLHGPYGPLPLAEVRRHALDVMDHLVGSCQVKMLVIACNTASAACLPDARERYPVPVVEVILPAVRRALATTRSGRIGVIGTQATIASGAYQDAFAAVPGVALTAAACPRFVDFVERGVTSGRQLLGLAENYLAPLLAADVDTLVLGCTHYPLLTGVISLVLGEGISLVSSAEETGQDVYRLLARSGLDAPADGPPPRHRFLATGDPEPFGRLGRRFLGPEVVGVEPVALAPV